MNDLMGLIYTGDNGERLGELTAVRAVAALPVLARYRVIDFVLSSLVSSGAHNVGIILQKNYSSLIDHLGSGKEWDLHRKRDGLFILHPFVTKDSTGVYRGTVDAIRGVLGYVRRSSQRYVILTGSHTIYNTTFKEMLRRHIETGAEYVTGPDCSCLMHMAGVAKKRGLEIQFIHAVEILAAGL